MSQIRIVTDSGCDLMQELVDKHAISVVPLKVRFGTEEFTDGVDITNEEFYQKMASSSELPSTAAPSQGNFEETFRQLQQEGATDIICVNMSYQLSATGQAAVAAAEAVRQEPGAPNIHTYDTTNVSGGLGTVALEAAKAANNGKPVEEVKALVADLIVRIRLFGVLDTLENLQKGGRIGKARAMMGSALSIKPIVEIRGEVKEAHKPRTRKRAFQWMRTHLLQEQERAGGISLLALGHGFASDFDDFCDLMAEDFDISGSHSAIVGPTIAAHAGPGVIGMSYVLGNFESAGDM